mgnify:CR=1 FL=1
MNSTRSLPGILVLVFAILIGAGCGHVRGTRSYRAAQQDRLRSRACGGGGCVQRPHIVERWKLYTGIVVETAALTSIGVGIGNTVYASRRRDQSNSATGIGERGVLLDQAERHERGAIWAYGVGVPLAVAGATFLLWDLLAPPQTHSGTPGSADANPRHDWVVVPTVGADGSVGVGLRLGL